MPRSILTEIIDAANKTVVAPFFAVDLEFDSPNELRFWSGVGDLVVGGVTYVGAGNMLSVSEVRESSDLAANGATLTLSGIPSNLIDLAIGEPYQGRIARINFGLIDYDLLESAFLLKEDGDGLLLESGGRIDLRVTQPANFFNLFSGYMDQMNIVDSGDTSTIALSIENKLIDLERPRVRRYTDQSQQSRFPGDLAFEFVNRLQSEEVTWTVT